MLRAGLCRIKFLDKGLDDEEGRDSSGGEGASIEKIFHLKIRLCV